MRYFAVYKDSDKLIAFGIGYDGVEITEEEYHALENRTNRIWAVTAAVVAGEIAIESVDDDIHEDVRLDAVAQFAEMVYSGAPIDTIPESIREDVQTAVDALITERGEPDEQEIGDTEALNIILGESE